MLQRVRSWIFKRILTHPTRLLGLGWRQLHQWRQRRRRQWRNAFFLMIFKKKILNCRAWWPSRRGSSVTFYRRGEGKSRMFVIGRFLLKFEDRHFESPIWNRKEVQTSIKLGYWSEIFSRRFERRVGPCFWKVYYRPVFVTAKTIRSRNWSIFHFTKNQPRILIARIIF